MPEKTNRQIEADKRRQHILETAIRAFLELGYQQTGIREIAKRANVSLGNLYNHFPSKEAVLVEIARLEALEIAPFVAQLQTDHPAQDRLCGFLESYLRYASEADHVLLSIEILAEAMRTPSVAEVFATTQKALITALATCLSEMTQTKQTHLADQARLILEMLEAHGRHLVFSEKTYSAQELAIILKMVGSGVGVALDVTVVR